MQQPITLVSMHEKTIAILKHNNKILNVVDIEVPGFETPIKFLVRNAVVNPARYESSPLYKTASELANGAVYTPIRNYNTVINGPCMVFDQNRACTTLYIPGTEIKEAVQEALFGDINQDLYSIFCEGKMPMTDASKMSSGPADVKQFMALNRAESK